MLCADISATESTVSYEGYETPFTRLTFTFHLRRKPLYHVVNIVIPCCIFSTVTLVSLLLQPDSSDRIALGLSI